MERELLALYGNTDPVYDFYKKREFKAFWLHEEQNLSKLIEVLDAAETHGLEKSKYFIERLKSGLGNNGNLYTPHV